MCTQVFIQFRALCSSSPPQTSALVSLRQLASSNHRSMQEQVRLLIERKVRYAQVGGVERARRWRSLLAGRHFLDLAADIQADRSR